MLEAISSLLKKIFFSPEIGSFYSLVSLLLTIFIFLSIRKIKNFYFCKVRLPQLIKKVKSNTSKISDFLNNFKESKDNIRLELGKLEANLKSLSKKINKPIKLYIKKDLKRIRNLSKNNLTPEITWEIYREVSKTLEEINNYFEDIKWEA